MKGKRGASQRKVVQTSFSPSTCCSPPGSLSQAVTSAKGRGRRRTVPGEELGKSGMHVMCQVPLTGGYPTAESEDSQEASQSPGLRQARCWQGTREGQEVVGHPPRGLCLANNLQKPSLKLYIRPQGMTVSALPPCLHPELQLRGPGRPL